MSEKVLYVVKVTELRDDGYGTIINTTRSHITYAVSEKQAIANIRYRLKEIGNKEPESIYTKGHTNRVFNAYVPTKNVEYISSSYCKYILKEYLSKNTSFNDQLLIFLSSEDYFLNLSFEKMDYNNNEITVIFDSYRFEDLNFKPTDDKNGQCVFSRVGSMDKDIRICNYVYDVLISIFGNDKCPKFTPIKLY